MAKKAKTIGRKEEKPASGFSLNNFIPEKYHLLFGAGMILLLFLIFLSPMYFGGKTFESGDILTSKSMLPTVQKEREGFTLWNPYIFLGLPAYATGIGFTWFNLIYAIFTPIRDFFASLFSVDYTVWTFYLLILAFNSFLLMRYLTKNTMVSLFTALATSFSTGIIVFLYIGHVTKLTALCWFPLILLMLLRFQQKIKLLDFFILTIALQLFIQGFHVQIIYYTLMTIGFYFAYYIICALIQKNKQLLNQLWKSALTIAGAGVIAILIQADNLTQVYEYTPYSTRGTKGILEKTSEANDDKSNTDYYDYHTGWSFSPGEVMTFFIPSFYGFGNSTYEGDLSGGKPVEVNTYFGQMAFVDVAMYMGIVVFFLAIIGVIIRWRDPLVKFLAILSTLALIISFGRNLSFLFDLLFYHLPYFDKFRVPSMILVLVQLSVPILAGLGLWEITRLVDEKRAKAIQLLKYFTYGISGVLVLLVLGSSGLSNLIGTRIDDYAAILQSQDRAQMAQQYIQLKDYIAGMFVGDALIGFGLVTLTFWGIYLYFNRKVTADLLVLAVIVFMLIDLWRIDSRGSKYKESPEIASLFATPSYVSAIRNQKDKEPFRILNLKQDGTLGSIGQNSDFNAYFLMEDMHGYSGIKPRAYQDMMDVVTYANPTLWRMANVKYLILQEGGRYQGMTLIDSSQGNYTYRNESALPRFFFVNKIETKPSIDVLNLIKENRFDPKEISYIQDASVKVDSVDSTAQALVTKYTEEKISVKTQNNGSNFLFWSSTYFPVGWKAYIDGNETKLYRTNHAFSGIVVPKGKHKVDFVYLPESWVISKYLALILSALVVGGLLLLIGSEMKKRMHPVNVGA